MRSAAAAAAGPKKNKQTLINLALGVWDNVLDRRVLNAGAFSTKK